MKYFKKIILGKQRAVLEEIVVSEVVNVLGSNADAMRLEIQSPVTDLEEELIQENNESLQQIKEAAIKGLQAISNGYEASKVKITGSVAKGKPFLKINRFWR